MKKILLIKGLRKNTYNVKHINIYQNIVHFFIIFLFFSCTSIGNIEDFLQRGDFQAALKYHDLAWKRMEKYGDTDTEVLRLYNKAIDEYKKCITVSNSNTGRAYRNLGRIYNTGPKTLRNYEEAVQYSNKAIEIYEREKKSEFIPDCYDSIAFVFYKLGDYNLALVHWKKAAELSSQYAVREALLYWLGLGVEQDLPKAMELYRKATAGNDYYWYWLRIYALEYQINEFNKGNNNNEGIALYMDYLHLRRMEESKEVWMPKLINSADLYNTPAQYELWIVYRDSKEPDSGMPYLQKALDINYAPALFEMGWIYYNGLYNTKINYKEAQKCYEKAAVKGYPRAQNNLGSLYYNKNIYLRNGGHKEMAYYWWKAAAEQGNSYAVKNLKLIPPNIVKKYENEQNQLVPNLANKDENNQNQTENQRNSSGQDNQQNPAAQLGAASPIQQIINAIPAIPIPLVGKNFKFELNGDAWTAKVNGENYMTGICTFEETVNGNIIKLKTTHVWSGAVEEVIDLLEKAKVPLGPAATPLRTAAKLAARIAKWIPLNTSTIVLEYSTSPAKLSFIRIER